MTTKTVTRTEQQNDMTGALSIVIEADGKQGLIDVRIHRYNWEHKPVIFWPTLMSATAEDAAIVYDLLGKAIQVARDVDRSHGSEYWSDGSGTGGAS